MAMPSRKLTSKCPSCHFKNAVDNSYCGNCGRHLRDEATIKRMQRDTKVHFDIAHPINPVCRQMIEDAVLAAYHLACQQGDSHHSTSDDGDEAY